MGTFIWWAVNYDRDFTTQKITTQNLVTTVSKLNDHVETIDTHGTRFSQQGIVEGAQADARTDARIQKLEDGDRQLFPKIDKMEYNIDAIMEWVKEQKQKTK